jgi:hypothetical protein
MNSWVVVPVPQPFLKRRYTTYNASIHPYPVHHPSSYTISHIHTQTAMGEGLTRRRAGGAGGSPITTQSDQIASSSNPSSSNTGNANKSTPNPNLPPSGSKVAYDPRDFQDDAESDKMPRLTLMEEVLLLGLKDKAVCRVLLL